MNEQVEVLLVEDNKADVLLVQEALKDARLYNTLHVAEDGEAAIAFLNGDKMVNPQGVRPGLVLLDLYLPKVGGLEVLKHIKGNAALKGLPVVIMTSSQEEQDIAEAYELQANCYITKPVDYDQLIKVIKEIEAFWLTLVRLPTRS